jgi:soluble lytic murein transglycosylase-like protein
MDYAAGLMEQYLEKFGSYRLALAAYQAGESSVVSARGVPRIPETVWYIDSVLSPDD